MKEAFITKDLGAPKLELIALCNTIIDDLSAQGYTLTLRQLYYQLVARDLIPNRLREYKRLGDVLNDARLVGLVDWDAIEDRTRNLRRLSHWDSPEEIVDTCAEQYRRDLWENQPNYVEVWVEKDALVGVLEKACDPLDVPYFSCRGYTSQSELYAAGKRLARKRRRGQEVHIIQLGDMDPSGWDMTRDIEDRLRMFAQSRVKVHRIALNMHQVEEYSLPPNPAKSTDSRFGKFVEEFGDESWELDAMAPSAIDELITSTVRELIDEEEWRKTEQLQEKEKNCLQQVSSRWHEVAELVSRHD